MTNLPTVQLPAHLAAFQATMGNLLAVGEAAIGGIQSGAHPRISIKQNRWRLVDVQGNEQVLPTLELYAIVIDANPNLSKIYYDKPYNPADTEPMAPACFSDNGVGPSSRAEKPQSVSCAACPHNVWGSKITSSGAKTRACGDSKKIAVILADNPNGPVYELRIPAASMANFANAVKQLFGRGIPLPAVIFRLTFDTTSDYPKILFEATGYATAEQMQVVTEVLQTDEVIEATGRDDQPYNGPIASAAAAPVSPVMPAPAAQPAAPVAAPVAAPFPQAGQVAVPVEVPQAAPLAPVEAEKPRRQRRAKAEAAPAAGAPLAPVATVLPPVALTPVAMVPTTVAPPAMPFAAPAPLAPVATAPAPVMAAPVAAMPFDQPSALPPAASVPVAAAPTDAALDAILGDALS